MACLIDDEFIYFIKILDENDEEYYLKSSINEQNNTILINLTNLKHSWVGTLNQEQVKILAKKFPSEINESFYSHTQRAFSRGNKAQIDGKSYVFNCKKLDKNRLEFVWKEKIEALDSLKIIGSIELQERPNDEILSKIMDYTINEMETLRTANEQKVNEIQRINNQLNKALETVKRTVDLKEQLEKDLYRKFVVVLNTKKAELARLKHQIEHSNTGNGNNFDSNPQPRSTSPMHIEQSTNKRARHQITDPDTSEDEDIQEIEIPSQSTKQSALKLIDNKQDSSLDLGDDQTDYKTSTVSKHHQRRKYVTGTNTISKRPFVNQASMASAMITPSLPDDSQTTDDLLNKI